MKDWMPRKTEHILHHEMYKSQLNSSDWKMYLTIFVLFLLHQNNLHYTIKIHPKLEQYLFMSVYMKTECSFITHKFHATFRFFWIMYIHSVTAAW